MKRAGWLVVWAAVMLGCSPGAPTQLIVVVDTDLRIPTEIDRLSIEVVGPSGMHHTQMATLTGTEMLPFTLTLVPNGDALGPIDIDVRSTLRGTSVLGRSARVTLVRGETRTVLMHLARSCIGTTCSSGQTCGERGCVLVAETPLYAWSGMPSRLRDDAGVAIDGGRDAGPVDSGLIRDANVDAALPGDAGPDCTSIGCDDMNPCTEDVCNAMRTCEHRPLDIACDDGMFCNGLDHCGSGTCSLHGGNPCVGSTLCDETRDVCTGCTDDASCPGVMMGGFGPCGGFADTCSNAGTHTQLVRTFHCMAGTCVASDTMSSEACFRDTSGTSCAPTSCGGWSACNAATTCGVDGTISRTCTDSTCSGGSCVPAMRTETSACMRATDGMPCGSETCGGWGSCGGFSEPCGTSGTQSRNCTSPLCAGGACGGSTMRTETQGCGRSTDGNGCGSTTCDPWGPCDFGGDPCRTDGTQQRTCHDPVCSGGGCGDRPRTESQGCSRSTDGMGCGAPECGAFDCTGGLWEYQCDGDGFLQASCRDRVCGGGTCGYGPYYTMNGGGCSINTDGSGCYQWSPCDYCWGGGCQYGGC